MAIASGVLFWFRTPLREEFSLVAFVATNARTVLETTEGKLWKFCCPFCFIELPSITVPLQQGRKRKSNNEKVVKGAIWIWILEENDMDIIVGGEGRVIVLRIRRERFVHATRGAMNTEKFFV